MSELNLGGKEFTGEPGQLPLEVDFNLGNPNVLSSYVYESNRIRAFTANKNLEEKTLMARESAIRSELSQNQSTQNSLNARGQDFFIRPGKTDAQNTTITLDSLKQKATQLEQQLNDVRVLRNSVNNDLVGVGARVDNGQVFNNDLIIDKALSLNSLDIGNLNDNLSDLEKDAAIDFLTKRATANLADVAATADLHQSLLSEAGLENASSEIQRNFLADAPTVTDAVDAFDFDTDIPVGLDRVQTGEAAALARAQNASAGVVADLEDFSNRDLRSDLGADRTDFGQGDDTGLATGVSPLTSEETRNLALDEFGGPGDEINSATLNERLDAANFNRSNVGASRTDFAQGDDTGLATGDGVPIDIGANNPLNSAFKNEFFPPGTTAAGQKEILSVGSQGSTVKSVSKDNFSDFSGAVATANSIQEIKGIENRLHAYANYTYRISLYMMSKDDYQTAHQTPSKFRPKNCIVSGAGKHDPILEPRHPDFKDDFYFDELKIQTMVGMNAKSKSANVLELSFTLLEPYGITFLDRLVNASSSIGSKNYLDMPYLLQIEFFGHTDEGTTDFKPIPGTKKVFPIRLLTMDIDVDTRGAVYKIVASPFNSGAFDNKIAVAGVNLQVTANTVEKFFQGEGTSSTTTPSGSIRSAVLGAAGEFATMENALKTVNMSKLKISVDSYASGLNGWFEFQKNNGAREHPDVILFKIDPEIASSKIVKPLLIDPKKTQMAKPGTPGGSATAKGNGEGPDPNRKDFVINAGTTVQKTVDLIIRASDYISNQIIDDKAPDYQKMSPEDIQKKLDKPFNWYKIIPSLELGEFDNIANRFARKITYHIKKYTIADAKHPHAPAKRPVIYQKSYNYLYTGQNKDVLDFKISFNALYYQVVSLNRDTAQTSQVTAAGKQEGQRTVVKNPEGGKNKLQPRQIEYKASGGDNPDTKQQTIDDVQQNLYQNAKADMINVSLKITGDPDFIKQDDVYVNPTQSDYETRTTSTNYRIDGTGSLIMDRGEIFALVRWRTPVDIDEETGLIRNDGRYRESSFSGMFKILGVSNEFRNGQFTQTIDLIRQYDLEKNQQLPERDQSLFEKRNAPKPTKVSSANSGVAVGNITNTSAAQVDDLATIPSIGQAKQVQPQVDDFGDIGAQSLRSIQAETNGIAQTVSQVAGALSGGGFGVLADAAGDLASAALQGTGALSGISKAAGGFIDELSGVAGLSLPALDLNALKSAGDVIQEKLNIATSFANGTGVTGANTDLAQLAIDPNEFDSLTTVKVEQSRSGTNNSNTLLT